MIVRSCIYSDLADQFGLDKYCCIAAKYTGLSGLPQRIVPNNSKGSEWAICQKFDLRRAKSELNSLLANDTTIEVCRTPASHFRVRLVVAGERICQGSWRYLSSPLAASLWTWDSVIQFPFITGGNSFGSQQQGTTPLT